MYTCTWSTPFIVLLPTVHICIVSAQSVIIVAHPTVCRLKLSYQSRLELSVGNEVLRVVDDRRLVSAVPLRDRAVCIIYPYFLVYMYIVYTMYVLLHLYTVIHVYTLMYIYETNHQI